MSHEVHVHEAQTKILRELLFLPETSFAELQKVSGLESDHVKFHIKRLVDLNYVEKNQGKYRLSIIGKEYANKLDTDAGVIERQPKVAVMLVIERTRGGKKQYVVQQRTKHPLYGFWGCPTGKVRWGESIYETASRELVEETGLKAHFVFAGEYHERVIHGVTGEVVEDKLFQVMFTDKAEGELLSVFEGGKNVWRTMEDMQSEPKRYKSYDIEMAIGINLGPKFTEKTFMYDETEF